MASFFLTQAQLFSVYSILAHTQELIRPNKDLKDPSLLKPALFYNDGSLNCHLSITNGIRSIVISIRYFTS